MQGAWQGGLLSMDGLECIQSPREGNLLLGHGKCCSTHIKVYHNEGVENPKGKGAWAKSRRNQTQASSCPLLVAWRVLNSLSNDLQSVAQ